MNLRLLTLCLLLASFSLEAQTFKAGLILGLNASQIDGDDVGGYSNPGLRAGIRASTMLRNEKLQLDTDMLFSQRGSRPSANEVNIIGLDWSFRMDYVEVPITLRYSDWYVEDGDYYKVYAKGGLSYGRFFRSKHSDLSPFRNIDEYINNNDLSITAGMGVYLKKHLQAEINYTRSIFPFYVRQVGLPWGRSLIGYFVSIQFMYEI